MKRVIQIAVPIVLAASTLVVANVAGAADAPTCDGVRQVEKASGLVLSNSVGCTPTPN